MIGDSQDTDVFCTCRRYYISRRCLLVPIVVRSRCVHVQVGFAKLRTMSHTTLRLVCHRSLKARSSFMTFSNASSMLSWVKFSHTFGWTLDGKSQPTSFRYMTRSSN